jgi:hypothetical protein
MPKLSRCAGSKKRYCKRKSRCSWKKSKGCRVKKSYKRRSPRRKSRKSRKSRRGKRSAALKVAHQLLKCAAK